MLNDKFIYYFTRFVIAVVVIAILAGFFVTGSPQKRRMQRFDETRVNDLQSLQYNIIYYWQAKQKLPETLGALDDPTRGVIVPQDPATGNGYEYVVKGPLAFSLCAAFDIQSAPYVMEKTMPVPPPARESYPEKSLSPDSWSHGAGRICFDRAIDTDFYKPLQFPPTKQ